MLNKKRFFHREMGLLRQLGQMGLIEEQDLLLLHENIIPEYSISSLPFRIPNISIMMVFALYLFLTAVSLVGGFVTNRAQTLSQVVLNVRSKALPFLEAPKKLDGTMVGDFGFDPLGLTDTINDLNYVRAAEIKHCRVAMLAVVGFLVQQQLHFLSSEADPIKAIASLGFGPNLQILSFIGVIELATWHKTFFGSDPGNVNRSHIVSMNCSKF